MNTKRRLSDDLSNDSEILSEKRFVKLYKEELESIEKQIHDLKKLDQKDFDVKPEVEDKARLYYRTFAREFYDVCEGRVSDEEFFDLWEREEELKAGLNSINSLEGEQKQLEKELVHANEDETMMNGKIKAAQEKRRNKKALFISFLQIRNHKRYPHPPQSRQSPGSSCRRGSSAARCGRPSTCLRRENLSDETISAPFHPKGAASRSSPARGR